jgi:hypothetical protein
VSEVVGELLWWAAACWVLGARAAERPPLEIAAAVTGRRCGRRMHGCCHCISRAYQKEGSHPCIISVGEPTSSFLLQFTTMTAQRSVAVLARQLRPAINGLRSPSIRPPCASTATGTAPLRVSGVLPYRCVRHSSSDSRPAKLAKTGLYDLHASHGAKFVPFAGYHMPVQYSDLGIGESHHWTREKASLFDVGHM